MNLAEIVILFAYLDIGLGIAYIFIYPSNKAHRWAAWWEYISAIFFWPFLLIGVGSVLLIDQWKWNKLRQTTDWGFHIKNQTEIREEITNNGK